VTKLANTAAEFLFDRHQQGVANAQVAEEARQRAVAQGRTDGDGINGYTKVMVYFAPFWNTAAPISHAND
jgi:hypothetical protein